MTDDNDDLVTRSLASAWPDAADGAERRKARFEESLAEIEAHPTGWGRIFRIAAEAGITGQDEAAIATRDETASYPDVPDDGYPDVADYGQVPGDINMAGYDMSMIEEARQRQEQVNLILQNTLQMQDKLIAQGEKMHEAMAQLEEYAETGHLDHKPRSRGTTASQITMPGIVMTLIAATAWLATRPSGVASTAAFTFAGVVVLYTAFYVSVLFMSARAVVQGNGRGERVLRLLLGSLSVEERLAEARASAISRALRNTPSDDNLTLQVGTTENPDIIELTRKAASRRASGRKPPRRKTAG